VKPQFRLIAAFIKPWRTLLLLLILAITSPAALAQGGELRLCLNAEPKTLNPLLVKITSRNLSATSRVASWYA